MEAIRRRLHNYHEFLEDFEITSDADESYNCIAWAATQEKGVWWEPDPEYYWLPGAPYDYSVDSLKGLFSQLGFVECQDGTLELGFQKVAIFAKRDEYEHASLQLPNGRWTSKLGPDEDIEHATPEELRGVRYGVIIAYMRKPTTNG